GNTASNTAPPTFSKQTSMPFGQPTLDSMAQRRQNSPAMRYVGAIDQGTTSTRFIVFDHAGAIVASAQQEHAQIYPQPGWVEHSPAEIVASTRSVIAATLAQAHLTGRDVGGVGLPEQRAASGRTNQREPTGMWARRGGAARHTALVWQDTRVDPLVSWFASQGGKDR